MKQILKNLWNSGAVLLREQEGQDLIEYALVVALIALAATVGMNAVAGDINTAFTNVGTRLTTAIT